jgi:GDP-L-fucose synthase
MNQNEGEEIINIGAGKDSTIRELAELVAEVVGFKVGIAFDSSKPDGTFQKLLDISKLRRLGWKKRISLREGIRNTYRWYLENP